MGETVSALDIFALLKVGTVVSAEDVRYITKRLVYESGNAAATATATVAAEGALVAPVVALNEGGFVALLQNSTQLQRNRLGSLLKYRKGVATALAPVLCYKPPAYISTTMLKGHTMDAFKRFKYRSGFFAWHDDSFAMFLLGPLMMDNRRRLMIGMADTAAGTKVDWQRDGRDGYTSVAAKAQEGTKTAKKAISAELLG